MPRMASASVGLALVALRLLTACNDELNANPRRDPAQVGECKPEESFGALLDQRCVTCHGGPLGKEASYSAQARAKWTDVEWKRVLDAIQARRMPPAGNPPLTDDMIAKATTCVEGPCPNALPNRLAMVSRNYVLHALEEIFPESVAKDVAPAIDALTNAERTAPFRSVTTGGTFSAVNVALEIGWRVAFQALAKDTAVDSLDSCLAGYGTAAEAAQRSCIDAVLDRYASAILRRAPTAEDRTSLRAIYTEGTKDADHREGLRFALAYLLERPEFLYHLENATGPSTLDRDEILAKLARYLWDSPPNAQLRAAAEGKDLATAEARQDLARQMLGDSRARRQVKTFYGELLRLDDDVALTMKPALLENVDPSTLHGEARDELLAFVDHVGFGRDGKISDIFTSNEAFVSSPNLALVYGLPATEVGKLTQLPDRKGILTRAAMLLSSGDTPNVFHYGATIAKNLLCRPIGPPDPAAIAEAAKVQIPELATARERAQLQTGSGVCVGCHSQFNAYGFGRTGYSSIGKKIGSEKIFDDQGAVVREVPVDTAGEIMIDGQNVVVKDLGESSEALGKSAEATRCFVSKFVSYTEGRATSPADRCYVDRVAREVATGSLSLREALVRIVASQEFVTRGAQ
jgi:hypothetical protein